jgi:hypothetical protein
MPILVSHDLLLNQLKRDSGRIAESFDALCESDIKEVSKLLAQASTLLLQAMHDKGRKDKELHSWSVVALLNIANSLSAAAHVLRAGYLLVPGVILRNAVEAMAVCLHGLLHPAALKKIQTGEFDSPVAIPTAKKVIPPFGLLYGLLSKSFTHIGPLHHQLQPLVPYTERSEALELNLRLLRAAAWLFYVVVEFAFIDLLGESGRYWKLERPNKAIYSPSEAEREWQAQFLGVPSP